MRRLTVVLLAAQIFLTVFVVVRDFAGLAQLPLLTILTTGMAFSFVLLHSAQNLGGRDTALFIALTIVIAFVMECVGVATGLIYGPYHYTDKLGPKFLDLVPFVIPLAWTMMLYPAYLMAAQIVPKRRNTLSWILILASTSAVAMTAWDLVMDPLMVAAGHWVWEIEGSFFGIPLQNYAGWWLTAFLIMCIFLAVTARRSRGVAGAQSIQFRRLAILSYATTGLSTTLLAFNNDLAGPALAGLFAMLPWILVGWWGKE